MDHLPSGRQGEVLLKRAPGVVVGHAGETFADLGRGFRRQERDALCIHDHPLAFSLDGGTQAAERREVVVELPPRERVAVKAFDLLQQLPAGPAGQSPAAGTAQVTVEFDDLLHRIH